MARPRELVPYERSALPIIEGSDIRYLQNELERVEEAFADLVLMTPQVATAAPRIKRDGMIRLARAPWRPIGGTIDAWVYWDAPTATWKPK